MDDSANLQHKTPSITFPSLFKSFLLLPLEVTKVYREGSHFSPSKQWLQTVYVAWINTWISLGPIYDKRVNMRECEHLLRAETSPVKAANSRLMTDFTCRQKQTEHRVILFFTTATNVRQHRFNHCFHQGGLVGIQWQMLNIKSLSSSEENSVSASSSSNWCYSSVFLLQAHLFPDTSGHCGFQQTLLKQERTVNLSGTFISGGWKHVLCSIEAKTMLNLVKISSRGCFYGEEDTTVQLTDAFLIVLGQERTQRKKKKTEYHQI